MTTLWKGTKQPAERLPWTYTPVDDMTEGDVLVPESTQVIILPSGTLVADLVVTNTLPKLPKEQQTDANIPRATVWLAAGTAGQKYKVTIRVTSSAGAIYEDEWYVTVKDN